MNVLHENLTRLINEKIQSKRTIALYIKSKLVAQGIEVSDIALDEIERKLEDTSSGQFTIDAISNPGDDGHTYSLDLGDTLDFEDFVLKLTEKLSTESVQKVIAIASKDLSANLSLGSSKMLKVQRQRRAWFEAQVKRNWGPAISLLETFILTATQACDLFNNEYKDKALEDNNWVYFCVSRLNARACQISSEILTLLKAGFADGALARWRALHEASVTTFFIIKHGQDVAERYFHYTAIESYRASLEYQVHQLKLNLAPLLDEELEEIKANYDKLEAQYGKPYVSGFYGWASNALKKAKADYNDIERDVELSHLRPYYKLASSNIHSSPKGLFFQLGLGPDGDNIHPTGPSVFGLSIPGQSTAISLLQITVAFLDLEATLDVAVWMSTLSKLEKEVCLAFAEVE